MPKNSPLIIVECDDQIDEAMLVHLYREAKIIYGLQPNIFSKNKFRHLFNKDFFHSAVDSYGKIVSDEFLSHYPNKLDHKLAFLSYFTPTILSPLLFYFLIKKIQELYPQHFIKVISTRRNIIEICRKFNPRPLNNIEFLYRPVKVLRYKISNYLLSNPSVIYFILKNLLICLKWIIKSILLKFKYPTQHPRNIDILFFSSGFRYWNRSQSRKKMDFYYARLIDKINSKSCLKAFCMAQDLTYDLNCIKHSIPYYMPFKILLRSILISLYDFMRMVPKLKPRWIICEINLYRKFLLIKQLEYILNISGARAVIYYDEVYTSGKIVSYIANKLKVDTYGFQHGIDTYSHPTYKMLRYYKRAPEFFPRFFLVYGPYSEKLFSDYGYPIENILKIGLDRLGIDTSITNHKGNSGGLKQSNLLFVGEAPWINENFKALYKNRHRYPIRKLFFRPHPSFPVNPVDFKRIYPNAILVDCYKTSISDNIRDIDYVVGSSSTALWTAIVQKKITVCWLAYGIDDSSDMNYWGAQIVDSLAQISWARKANPQMVLEECISTVDIVAYLERKYKKPKHLKSKSSLPAPRPMYSE